MTNNHLLKERGNSKPKFQVDKSTPQARERFTGAEMTEFKRLVGNRINEIFDGANDSEIARRCLTTSAVIKTYRKGERLPIAELLVQMHRATGVSLDWLLLGKGRKFLIEKLGENFSDDELSKIQELAKLSNRKLPEMIAVLVKSQLAALQVIEKH